jgi:hypothetical protein
MKSKNENRHMDQWNRIGDLKTNPSSCSHFIRNKSSKKYIDEKTAFTTNGAGKTGYSHVEDRN